MTVIKRIKGTQDILPERIGHWHFVEEIVRSFMERYNYQELRTPVFEQTELFARGIGQATDIVSKEMYTFRDRGRKSLTLKPEMTAPIMRAYLENNLAASSPMTKIYYIAPLFRQENPQAGRLRQFNQFGAEAIGPLSPELDAETVILAMDIYNALSIKDLTLMINSVGDPASREAYKEVLKEYVRPSLSNYCKDCRIRFDSNPLRILDCKVEICRELNQAAPKITEHLGPDGTAHFERLKDSLTAAELKFKINPHLVRGLDYYTHTVYEITSSHLGSQDAICGGGRYDLLSEQLGGKPVPAVGFASGIERLLMVLESQHLLPEQKSGLDIFICVLGPEAERSAPRWIHALRKEGYRVDCDYLGRSMKAQMREANRQNAGLVLVLGENELQEHKMAVKDMAGGDQEMIPFSGLIDHLRRKLPLDK